MRIRARAPSWLNFGPDYYPESYDSCCALGTLSGLADLADYYLNGAPYDNAANCPVKAIKTADKAHRLSPELPQV